MSKYRITLDGKVYEMEIERIDDDNVRTSAPSEVKKASPAPENVPKTAPALPPSGKNDHAAGGDTVVSPMPGTIVRLNVSAGDRVRKGQPVLVLEAMKMENEIVAGKEGTITSLYVSQGDTVQGGAALFDLGE